MYIHFLGTGTGGSPGSRRWRAANLVDTGEYLVVVDCGVGCHYRLSDRGLLTEVDYVFITHSHMDHFLGLPEALFQAHIEGRTRPLYIYAPRVAEEAARLVATHLFKSPRYEIVFRRVSPGVLLDLPGLRVEAAEACHHTAEEAYAYRLSAGVDVLFSGDTAPRCEPLRRLGAGADVAVYEATCNEENKEHCRRYAHSTTLEALAEGEAMKAGELVLTHINDRLNPTIYQDVKKANRRVVVAEDNMTIKL
jgi:ribonuclease Z